MKAKDQSYLDKLLGDFLKQTKVQPPFLAWLTIICLVLCAYSSAVWIAHYINDNGVSTTLLVPAGLWLVTIFTAWIFSIYLSIVKNEIRGAMMTDAILTSFLIGIAGPFGLYVVTWFREKNRERLFWEQFLG